MMGYDMNTTEATAGLGRSTLRDVDRELARLSATVADLTAELAKTRRDLETANYQVDRLLALSNSMDDDFKAEVAKLSDPVAVYQNMLAGKIAMPTMGQIIHFYGRDVLARALEEKP